MNSNFRTLIIFDTNKLRDTTDGDVSYSRFNFSSGFNEIKSFIADKGLADYIDLAVPRLVVQELLKQKIEQYNKDISNFLQIKERLSELPETNFGQISLPGNNFDLENFLFDLSENFIRQTGIKLIDLSEHELGDVFKKIIDRAIEKKPPFKQGKNFSDLGFKDVVIWESILNYNNLSNYDKIILITKDEGFNNKCESEFLSKINKNIAIEPEERPVITQIEKEYESVILKNAFTEFVKKEYFIEYLTQELTKLSSVTIRSREYELEKTEVVEYLDSVQYPEEEEEKIDTKIIVSLIKGVVTINKYKNYVVIKAKTYLDDANGIQFTEFEVDEN